MKPIALSLALLATGLAGGAWADDKTCDKDFAAAVEEKIAEFKAQKPKPAVDEALAWDVARITRDANILYDWATAAAGFTFYEDAVRLARLGIAVGLVPDALIDRLNKMICAEVDARRHASWGAMDSLTLRLIELSLLTGEPMEKITADYERVRAEFKDGWIHPLEIVRASYLSGRSQAYVQARYRPLFYSTALYAHDDYRIKVELIKVSLIFDRSLDRIVNQYEDFCGRGYGRSRDDCAHYVALLNIRLSPEKELEDELYLIHQLTHRRLSDASEREIQKTVALLRLLRAGVPASDPRVMTLF